MTQNFLRAGAAFLGILFVYLAICLYPNEREVLENRLVSLWMTVASAGESSQKRARKLLVQSALVVSKFMDSLFRGDSLSGRSIFISFYVSLSSTFIFISRFLFEKHDSYWRATFLLGCFCGTMAFVPAIQDKVIFTFDPIALRANMRKVAMAYDPRTRRFRPVKREKKDFVIRIREFAKELVFLYLFTFLNVGFGSAFVIIMIFLGSHLRMYWVPTALIVGGVLCDQIAIVAVRKVLTMISVSNNDYTLVIGLLVLAFLPIALLSPLLAASRRSLPQLNNFWMLTATSNFPAAICSAVLFAFLALAFFHRLVWPVIERPIYAISDSGLLRNRLLLGTTGIALLAYASPILSSLFKALGLIR